MTNDDIKTLAEALQHSKDEKESMTKINKILRNKSCATLIAEFKHLMPEMQGKEINRALLVLMLAILHKNVSALEQLQKVLVSEDLIPNLYGALCSFFSGKSSSLSLKVELTDGQFPNRYAYITRFIGQFAEREIRDALYVVKILAMSDLEKFEELAFKDNTHMILLNMASYEFENFPSDALIARLMKDGDELQANIGFYFAVWDIKRDVQDYAQLRRDTVFPGKKTKKEIDKSRMHWLRR